MEEYNIRYILGLNETSGDVGIEIEVEAKRPLPASMPRGSVWKCEVDNSLRGHSMEYVLRKPCSINKVGEHINTLKEAILKAESEVKYSERAGVHVHVNVQELTPKQILGMALTYYCLESALVAYCGPDREGNHFCLRLEDADFIVNVLENAIRADNLRYLNDEDLRYSSLNFCSLFQYGSIEFRAMETNPEFGKIEEWSKMLVAIREYAKGLTSFDTILQDISGQGPSGWARSIIGAELFELINSPNFDQRVMRCMRPIQHLFYLKKGV